MAHLTIAEARALADRAMQAVGHTAEEARLIADHLIDCEMRGLSYGGLPRALSIVERSRRHRGARPDPRAAETNLRRLTDIGRLTALMVARNTPSKRCSAPRLSCAAIALSRWTAPITSPTALPGSLRKHARPGASHRARACAYWGKCEGGLLRRAACLPRQLDVVPGDPPRQRRSAARSGRKGRQGPAGPDPDRDLRTSVCQPR